MVRTFIAAPIPSGLLQAVEAYQSGLKDLSNSVRWVRPESLHVTLKFIGDVDPSRIAGMTFSLKAALASETSFTAALEGAGRFPSSGPAKVIWIGLSQGGSRLTRLAHRVDTALAGLGIAQETRPFRAHVTIGRVKVPKGLGALLDELEMNPFEGGRFSVDDIHLMKSTLTPTGAEYQIIETFKLRG